MKTLVLIAHPNIESSRVNKKWKESVLNETDLTVHDLYETYCDQPINVEFEQGCFLPMIILFFSFHCTGIAVRHF